MKKQTKKQEQGAIIIEIIAVIALLGVMGPLLFKQISARNEEVENINIATEVRIIKEALSSFLLSHHAEIVAECTQNEDTLSTTIAHSRIEDFLPFGYENIASGYKMTVLLDQNGIGGNRLQGYIIPDLYTLGLPQMNIRRVARISNLIGADGGIYINGNVTINGTGGAWQLASDELSDHLPEEHTFIATTGMDTYVPTVNFEDFDPNNIILPDDLALGKLHAWNYFSVGTIKDGAGSCFQLNHKTTTGTTANPDTIYEAGTNNCSPLFWVGSSTNEAISGDAFVKQKLHLRSSPDANSSIVLSSGHEKNDATTEEKNKARNIAVYDVDGKNIITMDATGNISIVGKASVRTSDRLTGSGDFEKLTIKNGRIDSNVLAHNAISDIKLNENPTIENNVTYSLDPRYTSVMNDIRLESRGGARLSDLLPTYSLKEIKKIVSSGKSTNTPEAINVPSCPKFHYPAIMVTPVNWHQYSEQEVIDTIVSNVKSSADGTLKQSTTPNVHANRPIQPRVTITYSSVNDNDYVSEVESGYGGAWHVSLTYVRNELAVDEMDIPTPITAIVHTYCVFDTTTRIDSNRPDTEK